MLEKVKLTSKWSNINVENFNMVGKQTLVNIMIFLPRYQEPVQDSY
jgi:hypothetical protein